MDNKKALITPESLINVVVREDCKRSYFFTIILILTLGSSTIKLGHYYC